MLNSFLILKVIEDVNCIFPLNLVKRYDVIQILSSVCTFLKHRLNADTCWKKVELQL